MSDITSTLAKLETLTQARKAFRATIKFDNGTVRTFDAPTRQLASAWCDRYLTMDDNRAIVDCSVFPC